MSETNTNPLLKPLFVVIGIFITVVALTALFNVGGFIALDYELTADDYSKLLANMFFIALLVERFIEVTLSISRDKDKKTMKLEIEAAKAGGKAAAIKSEKTKLVAYRADTARQAMNLGFVIGILLGLAGVQILGTLYDVTYLEGVQKYLFKGIDILLTASLIAGGSNGVNQVTSLMNDRLAARSSESN